MIRPGCAINISAAQVEGCAIHEEPALLYGSTAPCPGDVLVTHDPSDMNGRLSAMRGSLTAKEAPFDWPQHDAAT